MHVPRLVLVVLALSLAACATAPTRAAHGSFVERTVTLEGRLHRYQVFVPARDAAPAHPGVVLFLHGSGERGRDGLRPASVGLGPHLRRHMDDFPALVVFPQVPEGEEWSDHFDVATAALDATIAEFGADDRRVYLTGLSMGGYGTWDLALRQPTRFAALVPVCAGVTAPSRRPTLRVAALDGSIDPFMDAARRLRGIPAWVFHGAEDDMVPAEQSRRMAAALDAVDAVDARYTEFPGVGHASWDPAYAHAPLWEWLFAQQRD